MGLDGGKNLRVAEAIDLQGFGPLPWAFCPVLSGQLRSAAWMGSRQAGEIEEAGFGQLNRGARGSSLRPIDSSSGRHPNRLSNWRTPRPHTEEIDHMLPAGR